MGRFDEVALYGSLIHVVAKGVEQQKPLIAQALTQAGVEVRSMEVVPPSLEDVFISNVQA